MTRNALSLMMALGGCLAGEEPAGTVALQDGWNCDQGRCLRYFEDLNMVQVTGMEMIRVPDRIDTSPGTVSSRDFLRMFYVAQGADWLDAPG